MATTPSPKPFRVPRPPEPRRRERQWPRAIPQPPALVSGVSEVFVGRGLVLNVSRGGLSCQLHAERGRIGVGDEVLLKLNFHRRADTLRAAARVAWTLRPDPERQAIHYGFEWMEGADLWAIRVLVADIDRLQE